MGYPDLYDLSRSADCIGLSTTKRTALDRGADALDRALSAAAARNGDVFADVRPEFAGHEICDSASWLHSVTFPIGDSYHPNAAGQELGYLPAFTAAAGPARSQRLLETAPTGGLTRSRAAGRRPAWRPARGRRRR